MNNAEVTLDTPPRHVESIPGEPRVFLEPDAEASLEEHVQSAPDQEVCGLLLGMAGRDDAGYFTHIKRAVEGKYADQRGTSVTFTHRTWDYVYKMIADGGGAEAIVGWYHSHPGFGVFYSSHDTFIQEHFFSQPWQVGIVVDPSTAHRGVFVNMADGIRGMDRYWRLSADADEDAEPVDCDYQDRVAARDTGDAVEPSNPAEDAHSAHVETLECRVHELEKRFRKWRAAGIGVVAIVFLTAGATVWNTLRTLEGTSADAVPSYGEASPEQDSVQLPRHDPEQVPEGSSTPTENRDEESRNE